MRTNLNFVCIFQKSITFGIKSTFSFNALNISMHSRGGFNCNSHIVDMSINSSAWKLRCNRTGSEWRGIDKIHMICYNIIEEQEYPTYQGAFNRLAHVGRLRWSGDSILFSGVSKHLGSTREFSDEYII